MLLNSLKVLETPWISFKDTWKSLTLSGVGWGLGQHYVPASLFIPYICFEKIRAYLQLIKSIESWSSGGWHICVLTPHHQPLMMVKGGGVGTAVCPNLKITYFLFFKSLFILYICFEKIKAYLQLIKSIESWSSGGWDTCVPTPIISRWWWWWGVGTHVSQPADDQLLMG